MVQSRALMVQSRALMVQSARALGRLRQNVEKWVFRDQSGIVETNQEKTLKSETQEKTLQSETDQELPPPGLLFPRVA
jgi:hypothetical protein